MNKSDRLKALLDNGYFPEELPPPFTTKDFAKFRASIGDAWAQLQNYPKSSPEIYNVPRTRARRRDLSIVNPVAQYYLSKIISDEWVRIRDHIQGGSLSVDKIIIDADGSRAVPSPDFALVARRKSEISACYNYALAADISRFYSTLYTHAVAWALETKPWCKANLNTAPYHASLGARLDTAVRKGNDNQTLGIPVGPDTSRIVSEIVAVCIDRTLSDRLGVSPIRALRNVDDWFVGFDTLGKAEDAIAVVANCCREYQLEAHPDKTTAREMPWFNELPWPTALNQIRFSAFQKKQLKDIQHFFTLAFDFAKQYPDDNVLNYAVKVTSSSLINSANWREYETYLLRIARANHTTIPTIVQILTNYNASGADIDKDRVGKLSKDLIDQCGPTGRHAEVAWALFLAKALRIELNHNCFDYIVKMESSACALLTLDIKSRGLIGGQIDTSTWEASLTTEGLNSSMWLLAYEAKLKGWLQAVDPNYVNDHQHFSVLLSKGISFYNPKKNVPHIKSNKAGPAGENIQDQGHNLQYFVGMSGFAF